MRLFKARNGLNLMSAEDPTNYMLIFGFDIQNEDISTEILGILNQYWVGNRVEFGNLERD